MATEPADLPEWASANPTDPTSGEPAIIEPPAGKKQSGATRLEKPNRHDHNWLFNLIYLWIQWFKQQTDLNDTHRSSDGTDHSDVGLNNTHRGSDGTDHSDVVLNNDHRNGDGTDHAGVQAALTHAAGTGGDHSDVAQNTVHRNGDGSDHVDVGDNTTHRNTTSGNPHSVAASELADLDTEVAGTPAVTANTNHAGGDGSDHADVAANTAAIAAGIPDEWRTNINNLLGAGPILANSDLQNTVDVSVTPGWTLDNDDIIVVTRRGPNNGTNWGALNDSCIILTAQVFDSDNIRFGAGNAAGASFTPTVTDLVTVRRYKTIP